MCLDVVCDDWLARWRRNYSAGLGYTDIPSFLFWINSLIISLKNTRGKCFLFQFLKFLELMEQFLNGAMCSSPDVGDGKDFRVDWEQRSLQSAQGF